MSAGHLKVFDVAGGDVGVVLAWAVLGVDADDGGLGREGGAEGD